MLPLPHSCSHRCLVSDLKASTMRTATKETRSSQESSFQVFWNCTTGALKGLKGGFRWECAWVWVWFCQDRRYSHWHGHVPVAIGTDWKTGINVGMGVLMGMGTGVGLGLEHMHGSGY